jgi:hypothetical protein
MVGNLPGFPSFWTVIGTGKGKIKELLDGLGYTVGNVES